MLSKVPGNCKILGSKIRLILRKLDSKFIIIFDPIRQILSVLASKDWQCVQKF